MRHVCWPFAFHLKRFSYKYLTLNIKLYNFTVSNKIMTEIRLSSAKRYPQSSNELANQLYYLETLHSWRFIRVKVGPGRADFIVSPTLIVRESRCVFFPRLFPSPPVPPAHACVYYKGTSPGQSRINDRCRRAAVETQPRFHNGTGLRVTAANTSCAVCRGRSDSDNKGLFPVAVAARGRGVAGSRGRGSVGGLTCHHVTRLAFRAASDFAFLFLFQWFRLWN